MSYYAKQDLDAMKNPEECPHAGTLQVMCGDSECAAVFFKCKDCGEEVGAKAGRRACRECRMDMERFQ